MRFDIVTLFPEMFSGPFQASMLARAQEQGLIQIRAVNLRDHAASKHRITDDAPFGGGGGMVMKPEPLFAAVEALRCPAEKACKEEVVLLCPQGRKLTHQIVSEIAQKEHLILLCGHYESVDERVREHLATDDISIGDYVLTGGELPAMVLVDAVSRLVPGVLGNEAGPADESFASGLLEYPQYTRPAEFRSWAVPDILLSGDHERIRRWRREQALRRTLQRRPDLLERAGLTDDDLALLEGLEEESK
jgi:tRNA (guanine37-N1)-methyltransferase